MKITAKPQGKQQQNKNQKSKKSPLPLPAGIRSLEFLSLVEFYDFEGNQFLVWNLALSRIFA